VHGAASAIDQLKLISERTVMQIRAIAAFSVLACAAATSGAQGQKMTPGLWESSVTMKSAGGQTDAANAQLQAKMASMTPEQRQMMEQAMASHGISLGSIGGAKPNVVKVCVSKEQAERDEIPQQDAQRNCQQQMVQRNGNSVQFKFTCTGQTQATGEGEFTMNSGAAYTGHTVIHTLVQGRPQTIEMDQSGKWLGADCGSVQPFKH
jgi:hypothetical protein